MDLEGARMQLLLGIAFGPHLAQGQAEWRDVPEVVRSSFVLVAKELRRLHRLLLANRQDPVLQRESTKNTSVLILKDEVAQLRAQIQDAQRQADERHAKIKQKLSDLWGEVAATANAAAENAASCEKTHANWAKAERQLQILEIKIEEQVRRRKRDKKQKLQAQQVDAALHELQKSQVLCSQELRRLQRVFEAHDHQVVGTTLQVHGGDAEKLRPGEQQDAKSKKGRQRSHDGAVHVLLHQR
jgi:chromosome segregation ATPase